MAFGLEALVDQVWPRACEFCARPVDRPGRHVCADCLMRVPFMPPKGCCRRCGRDAAGLDVDFLCEDCRGAHRPYFDRAATAVRFEGAARQAVLDYKFNRHLWLRADFVDWLEAALLAHYDVPSVDVVLPVAITRWHRYNRGFSQTADLARALAARIDRRYDGRVLVRVGRHIRRQSSLDEEARRENVKNTIAVRHAEAVRGRTVLVVDDIMTTGATLSETARVVKEAGAARVWCVAVARSVRS